MQISAFRLNIFSPKSEPAALKFAHWGDSITWLKVVSLQIMIIGMTTAAAAAALSRGNWIIDATTMRGKTKIRAELYKVSCNNYSHLIRHQKKKKKIKSNLFVMSSMVIVDRTTIAH